MFKKIWSDYFLKGFRLTNKSVDILFLSFLLSFTSYLPTFFANSAISSFVQLVSFTTLFINLGFTMSLPVFLLDKQQNKKLEVTQLKAIILTNTVRMILPGIALLVISGILGILFFLMFVLASVSNPSDQKEIIAATQNIGNQLRQWNPFFLLFVIFSSFFTFTAIYFSLEKKGLFSSLKKSFLFSIRHWRFITIVIVINCIFYTYSVLLPISFESIFGLIIRTVITSYVNLLILASALIYYQHHKESHL